MKHTPCVVAVLVILGCASGPHLGRVTDVVVEETGNSTPDDPQANCQEFQLTPPQVSAYLNHAVIVGGHHHFRWSPCYVKGTANIRGTRATWIVRQFGIGAVTILTHGVEYSLASPEAIRMKRERMEID